jgi:dTDP-D-glucose 4,6-dehydratase
LKILVTGGAGFIGSAVVRLAIARGHSIVNVDALTYAACLENVASVSESPNTSLNMQISEIVMLSIPFLKNINLMQ